MVCLNHTLGDREGYFHLAMEWLFEKDFDSFLSHLKLESAAVV